MRIWIDADAAPRDVKDIVLRASKRLSLEAILVANRRLPVPPGYPSASAVRVEGGPDVADRYILERAEPGDLVITADIPLAASLIEKKVSVIDPRGEEHSADTIGERLAMRDFMDSIRGAGIDTGGARPYGERDRKAFAGSLDRALTRLMRSGSP